MSKDIGHILRDWEFEPEDVCVRIVTGDDGRQKIQMRVELGVLQMEFDGRPDGLRPEERESWLDYYDEQRRQHDAAASDDTAWTLGEEDLARLWREGVQYYHRYLSFWHLKRYDLCARDTARNLRLFALVRNHARDDRHKLQFDQWRPYVLMMHARAVATPQVESKQYDSALTVIEAGIDGIRDFLDEYGQSERAAECVELINLERWAEEVREEIAAQASPEEKALADLKRQLADAIAREEFEEAARLRDAIRHLPADPKGPP